MSRRSGKLLRWTVPPGVSLLVHALAIVLIVYVSSRIVSTEKPRDRTPLSTLAVPAAKPPTPKTDAPSEQPQDLDSPEPFKDDKIRPESLARAIAALGMSPSKAPAMDPVAQAALQQSTQSVTAPTSTAPPVVRFAGVQTKAAKKIVYVVDGSGATASSFSSLQQQLLRSIDELSATQRFQVVLFRSAKESSVTISPINANRLAYATRANKQAVGDWLDTITTHGRSNPIDGLRAALALKPDLVLLITKSIERTGDGAWAGGRERILAELNELNPRSSRTGQRRTVIKAVQLLDDDPTGIMQAIGNAHGDGLVDYRVVSYDDLVRRDDQREEQARKTLGASDEQRLSTAGELLASIAAPGIVHTMLYGLPTPEQSEAATSAAAQIDALVEPLVSTNARAALMGATARLMQLEAGDTSNPITPVRSALEAAVFSDPIADANRRLLVARLAHAQGDYTTAIDETRSILADADELQLDELTRATGLLALCALGEEPSDPDPAKLPPPFVTPAGDLDPLWTILLGEARTRGRLETGRSNAWAPLVRIRKIAASDPSLVEYIDAKIAAGVARSGIEDPEAFAQMPSAVILAAARGSAGNPQTRLRAIDLLRVVAERNEPELAAEALWTIGVVGRAHNTARTRALATDALAQLATRFPDHPLAGDALTGAIANAPRDNHDLRRSLLRQAIDRYPDRLEVDLWRLDLARLTEDYERLDVLDSIASGTREGVLGGELYEQTILSMLSRYNDPSVQRALLSRMSDAASRLSLQGAPAWAQRAAASELDVDPDAAADRLVRLINEAQMKGEDTGELELLRARALIDAGKKMEAFGILNSIAARQDASDDRNDTYWQAWALMLETIARSGTRDDRSAARTHITRLRLVDPQLGGSPWKERITRASDELHSEP
ncbi:MAG: hypothetical protein KC996_03300 [Phycisphaerales bacterium]|nr:hypothetical protein [Phycisphaerales bacterium]